jgi:monofunctional biosynthetic peptidoglycan transglycosylase
MNPIFSAVQIQRRIESILEKTNYTKRYTFVPLNRISKSLQHAVIAAEDGRFYQHKGIDWKELRNAMEANLKKGRLGRGGSTISQQLVKNLFLTTHRSVFRKGLEFTLVPIAEFILPKKRILELYLNIIEWGPGVYGAEAASRYHYRISAARLNRERAARLAACIPAPLTRKPHQMNEYSAAILARMSKMGW